MPDLTRPRFNATVVTTRFEIVGQIEPIGPWLDFLNSRDKHVMPVYNARLLPIGTAAPAPERPVVYVNLAEIYLIHLPDPASHETVHMLKKVQTAICHIGPVICRGECHMGIEATLATYIDDLTGNFFPITNVDLHATVALPAPLPARADLILVNRLHVAVYHPA